MEDTQPDQTPVMPRIGDGALSIIAGIVLIALAVFASLAAAGGGGPGAGAAMVVLGAAGGFLFWVGFFKRMFHMIERRLIDIESRR